ncbi:MAG: UDP-glucose 4-epimerase-like protein [Planctomycetota bacterium]|nr:MAG: UDP-glucose 4-epimerase-like protein [Planctomycetota bacterium]
MTRVLVTGGAGFIGSHVSEQLLARGDEVTVVDNLSTGKRENLRDGVRFVEGDLAHDGVATRAMEGCEKVVHCAASASVTRSVEDPIASNEANLQGSARLILAARDAGVRRMVYSSSSAAYGGTVEGAAVESLREAPMSPYGMNKLAAEQLFRMAPELYSVDTVCLRYFNVFGPRQDPSSPYSGVISILVSKALLGEAPTIHGDGEQSRDFTYVGDVVAANLAALDCERGGGAVLNVGRGDSISLNQLWDAVRTACGVPDLQAEHGPARAGDIRHSRADASKLAEVLGVRAGVSLEDGLAATVAWYRSSLSTRA